MSFCRIFNELVAVLREDARRVLGRVRRRRCLDRHWEGGWVLAKSLRPYTRPASLQIGEKLIPDLKMEEFPNISDPSGANLEYSHPATSASWRTSPHNWRVKYDSRRFLAEDGALLVPRRDRRILAARERHSVDDDRSRPRRRQIGVDGLMQHSACSRRRATRAP